jgi:hypothetical protein
MTAVEKGETVDIYCMLEVGGYCWMSSMIQTSMLLEDMLDNVRGR